jgi:hypothetical protein
MSKVVFGAFYNYHIYSNALITSWHYRSLYCNTLCGPPFLHIVGNVPYNMGEVRARGLSLLLTRNTTLLSQEQLIDAFKSVGQVVGFRYSSRVESPSVYYLLKNMIILSMNSDLCTTEIPASQKATVSVNSLVHVPFCVSSPRKTTCLTK